jgi:hypothetical protein
MAYLGKTPVDVVDALNVQSLTVDNQVGIGTSSPAAQLEINSGGFGHRIEGVSANNLGIHRFITDTNDTDKFVIGYGASHPTVPHQIALKANNAAGTVGLYTVGIERMRIENNGDVTIGGKDVLTNTASSNGSSSGYIKLSNGLIIQWGRVTSTTTPSARSFPTTFPSNCTSVVATSRQVWYDVYVTSFNTSSFTPTVRYTTGGGNVAKPIFYIATGY